MTIDDIKNAGYRVFKTGDHSYDIYEGYSYHGIVSIEGPKKFFHVTFVKDCPLYNVKIQVKNVEELAEAIKKYFSEEDTNSHYYDMYNVQIVDHYRVESFVANILRKYGFMPTAGYGWKENKVWYKHDIGRDRSIVIQVDTDAFEMHAFFGKNSFTTDTFKMWDEQSVKDAISNVLTVPIITEIGLGFDLLTKIPMATKDPNIKSNALDLFGEKKDDVRAILENAKENIDKFLATL